MHPISRLRRSSTRAAALGSALIFVAATASACGSSDNDSNGDAAPQAGTCTSKFKVAAAEDDVRRAAFYAIENKKIDTSALPNLEVSHLAFPALIQSVGKKQYDVVESSLTGVAAARTKDVDLVILSLASGFPGGGSLAWYVKKESDVKTPADMKGKTFGVTSLGSSGTTGTRIVLSTKYGLDTKIPGGDVKFVQLPATQLVAALDRGQIDAADMYGGLAYQAAKDSSLRELARTDDNWQQLTGTPFIGAAYQMLDSQYKSKPACYLAFRKILDESVKYAKAHIGDFADQVAKKAGVPADFVLSEWKGDTYDYVGNVDPKWVAAAQNMWDQEVKFGTLPSAPDIKSVIVE